MKKTKPVEAPPPVLWILPFPYIASAFLLWAGVVLFFHFQNFPVNPDYIFHMLDPLGSARLFHPYMLKALGSFVLAAWIGWVAFEGGAWLLKRIVPDLTLAPLEVFVLGSGLGLCVLSYFTLAAGAMGLWYRGVFASVLGLLSFCFAVRRFRAPVAPAGSSAPPLLAGPWNRIWLFILAAFLLLFLLGDLTPEIFYDALYYHIAVPNLYRLSHRVYGINTLLFSNFVLTIQWLYGFALTLGTEITAKLLHGFMAILLALSFVAFGQRYLSKGSGLLAGIIFLSMPLVGINAITTGNDVAFSFLQFLAGYALVLAFTQPGRRAFMLAGVLTGFSASCKYPGFPFIPIAMLLVLWRTRFDEHRDWKTVIQQVLAFAVPAALVIAPVLIRNMVFHANPLYPFGGTHWGVPRIDPQYWHIFVSDANTRVLSHDFESWDAILHYFLHPWFITMGGGGNGDFVGPLYLLLLPLLFVKRANSLAYVTLRRYGGLLWLLWMLTTTTPRYGLPALALLAPLLADSLLNACRSRSLRPFFLGAVLLCAITNLYHLSVVMFNLEGWTVLGGFTTETDYLEHTHASYPTPPYEGIDWMNQNLPPSAKILFIGEARSHYIHFPSMVSSVPDPQPLVEFSKQAHSGAEMANLLRAQHITHLFLNYAEAVRTEGYGLFRWDASSWAVFQDFWSHDIRLAWKTENLQQGNPKAQYVFELVPESEATVPHTPPMNIFQRWAPRIPSLNGTRDVPITGTPPK